MADTELRWLSLCSGIAGLDLGIHRAAARLAALENQAEAEAKSLSDRGTELAMQLAAKPAADVDALNCPWRKSHERRDAT